MHQVEHAREQAGDAYEQKKSVIQKTARIPKYYKDGAGNDNGKYFRKAMEKKVVVLTYNVETGQDRHAKQDAKTIAISR
ncbi:MAG: hypothetical protein ABSA26_06725 [Thermoguttaceae bacterium]